MQFSVMKKLSLLITFEERDGLTDFIASASLIPLPTPDKMKRINQLFEITLCMYDALKM